VLGRAVLVRFEVRKHLLRCLRIEFGVSDILVAVEHRRLDALREVGLDRFDPLGPPNEDADGVQI